MTTPTADDIAVRRPLCSLLVIGLVLFASAFSARAAAAGGSTYYIATNGSDSNPGTLAHPWRTLQHAADVLSAGDTVLVRAGTYDQGVILTRSGSLGSPMTFAAYPGESVVLDGGGSLYTAFQNDSAANVSNVTIDGLTLQHFTGFGIVFWSINNRLTLTDLTIVGNGGEGLRLSNSDGTLVQHVLLQNNVGGFDCTPILPGDGTDQGCTNLHIADTRAVDNGSGDDTGVDAFAVEKGDHILVERSVASGGPGDGFDFKSDHTTLSQVIAHHTRNNIKLWGMGSTLVNALAYDASADANLVLAPGGSYTVTNVTIANMTGYAYLATFGGAGGSGTTPVQLHNAILFNDNPAMGGTLLYLGPDVTLDSDNNLYWNPYRTDAVVCAAFAPYDGQCFSADDINHHGWEQHSFYADPLFVTAPSKDFHLAAGSPAIDAGTPVGAPSVDLDNHPRDAHPDIGAYEWGTNGGTPTPTNTPTFTPTPTSTNTPTNTPTSTPTITVVENDDPHVQDNGWRGVSDANANGGTYRVSKVKNDKVTFKFTGTSVTWVTKKGTDQGKAQVTIDGKSKGTFDLYSLTGQWNVQHRFTKLTNKPHTLVVKVLGTKNPKSKGANIAVDAFIVSGTTTQDNDLSVQYNSWVGTSDSNASGRTYRWSATKNAIVSLSFTGTSINWITATCPAYGRAQVLIDGKVVDNPDLYSATPQWQVTKTYGNLSAGKHTIQIKVLGTKNKLSKGKTVVVDAFSGPITTTGTSVQVEPEVEDSSSSDTSWLFWMLPLGIANLVIVRRRF